MGTQNINCLSDKNNYSVSIKLPAGNVWCIDSTGVFSEVIAAKQLNFKEIFACEKEERFIEIGKKRIQKIENKKEVKQIKTNSLFFYCF